MPKTTVNHNSIVSTWGWFIFGFPEYYGKKLCGNQCVQYIGHELYLAIQHCEKNYSP